MKICALVLALNLASAVMAAEPPQWATKDLRAGIIGTDTSHVPAFTAMFRAHPEWRIKVVAAFKGGSPDLPKRPVAALTAVGLLARATDPRAANIPTPLASRTSPA
jgi:hypothetical protein